MANWMIKVAEKWLKPLYKLIKKPLLAGSVVYANETAVNYALNQESYLRVFLKNGEV